MNKGLKVILSSAIFMFLILSASFSEETLTITTYYPSPYGSYAELRANKMAVGSGYNDSTITIPADSLIVQGNVGIGTTQPRSNLHIDGGSLSAALRITNVNTGGTGTDGLWVGESQTGESNIWNYENTPLRFATNGAERMRIAAAGDVGIGITGPGAKLDVIGPATGSGVTIRAGGGGDVVLASGGSLFFDGNYAYASGNYIRPVAANTQAFFTSGAERMRITSAGNVGIGTGGAVGTGGLLQVGGTTANACGIYAETTVIGRSAMIVTGANPTVGNTSPVISATATGGPVNFSWGNISPVIQAIHTNAWSDTTGGGGAIGVDGQATAALWGVGVRGTGGRNLSTGRYGGAGVLGINDQAYGMGVYGIVSHTEGWGVYGLAGSTTGVNDGVRGESASSTGRGVVAYASSATGTTYALLADAVSPSGYAGWFTGGKGVNITANLYHGGTLHSGWDFAEYIKTSDGLIEEGDVVSIDKDQNVSIAKSKSKYDTAVLGVISTSPGDIGGLLRHEDSSPYSKEEMLKAGFRALSLAGQVPCKVTTENGSIKRGDILVTSSKAGYAMKADLDKVKPGMIVGKALEPLEKGEGKILVLVD